MKQNYKISLCALLLVGAVGMMTARAQGSGNKPTLAVFVVGNMDNTLVSPLAAQLGANLISGGQYTLTSVNTANKLAELQAAYNAGGSSSIDRNALAEWGHEAGISAICLVVDDVKGNDHLFSAQLIGAKDSKLSGRSSYIRTGVTSTDLPRVSLALSRQLDGPGRRRNAPAPARNYPAELDIEMVFVEGGTFTMGCTPEQGSDCQGRGVENPPHSVTLSSFYIGKYEVTQAQWKAVIDVNPSNYQGAWGDEDQRPVENVSWDGVKIFLDKLNLLTGKQYRLPTDAEWEYAARGGKKSKGYKYSGSNVVDDVSWCILNSCPYGSGCNNTGGATDPKKSRTHPVGQKAPNELEIYDMGGNVWEWCVDVYAANYYSTSPTTNPANTADGTAAMNDVNAASRAARVLRSSSGFDPAIQMRVAARGYYNPTPTTQNPYVGFRIVLPAQ
jgi:formylglycine-generating enzyme required for sulfatase activity